MKKVLKLFNLLVFCFCFLILTGCVSVVTEVGIKVTTNPTKTEYLQGECFDPSGMVVVMVYDNGNEEVITKYTYNTEPFIGTEDSIEIVYRNHKVVLPIKVTRTSMSGIELRIVDGASFSRTDDVSTIIEFRETYYHGETGEWCKVSKEDIKSVKFDGKNATVVVEIIVSNVKYEKEIVVPCEENVIGVTELLTKENDDIIYNVNGIVVAVATSMARAELIIMDKETKEMIGVSGVYGPGIIYNYTLDTNGFEVGDEVVIPVKVAIEDQKAQSSNSEKKYARYAGSDVIENCIVSKNNEYTYDLSSAVEINDQSDLINFLSPENRKNNHYKFVKINCTTNIVTYSSSRHYRFYFDEAISTLNDQKVDGVSPCFNDGAQYYTTGKTFSEIMFGKEDIQAPTYKEHLRVAKEIYALFIGGNGYYHEFVILDIEDVKDLNIVLEDTSFVEPSKLVYSIGEEFSLDSAKVVYDYTYGYLEEVSITLDMLDAATLPDMNSAGEYTVKGQYNGFNFEFKVVVEAKEVSSIEIDTLPDLTEYNQRCSLKTIDLTGGKIKVNYTNNTSEIIDMTIDMLSETDNFQIGKVSYPLTYGGKSTELIIDIINDAISVSEFKTKTSGTYDVEAIVVGPASSHAAIELIVKDVITSDMIGLYNTGVAGSAASPALDESIIKAGDRIIVAMTVKKLSNTLHTNGKVYANANTFKTSLIVLEKETKITWDLENMPVVTISSRAELEAFLVSEDRFYSVVKLVTPKAILYSTTGYRIFFGNESTLNEQKIDGVSPFIHLPTANANIGNLKDYFENSDSTKYSAPATTEYTIYALYVGGNGYYYGFVVLSTSWMVK